MVRPVDGYVTATGTFFESERDANLYESRYNIEIILRQMLGRADVLADWTDVEIKTAIDELIDTFKANHVAFREYLDAVAAYPPDAEDEAESGAGDEDRGYAVPPDPEDDQRVRLNNHPQVATDADAEADTPSTGEGDEPETQRKRRKSRL